MRGHGFKGARLCSGARIAYLCVMERETNFAGKLLLALPSIGDPRFHRAVIAMCSHDSDGALGIDIASPIDGITAGDVFDRLDIDGREGRDRRVLFGGPVEPQRGFVLHSDDWGGDEAIPVPGHVAGQWVLSGSLDTLKAIADGNGPRDWLLALGYAGWGAGQLEGELAANAWHFGDYDRSRFYDAVPDAKWSAAFVAQGIDPHRIASAAGTA